MSRVPVAGEKRRVIANGEILERRLQGDHERFVRIGHHARLGPGDAGLDNPLTPGGTR